MLENTLSSWVIRGHRAVLCLPCALAIALCACAAGPRLPQAAADDASATPGTNPVGASVAMVIPPDGGRVGIPNVVDIEFPPGILLTERAVGVDVIEDARMHALFVDTTSALGVTTGLPYLIRINIGHQRPVGRLPVRIFLPAAFRDSLPPDSWVRLYGYIHVAEDGMQMELFEHCGGRFRPADGAVMVPLSPYFFTTELSGDESYEAVLTLGVTVHDKAGQ